MVYIFFTSLIYLLLIFLIFNFKRSINSYDNRIYSILIITNIIGVFLDIIQYFVIKTSSSTTLIYLISKIFLIYIILWTFFICTYCLSLSKKNQIYMLLRLIAERAVSTGIALFFIII